MLIRLTFCEKCSEVFLKRNVGIDILEIVVADVEDVSDYAWTIAWCQEIFVDPRKYFKFSSIGRKCKVIVDKGENNFKFV